MLVVLLLAAMLQPKIPMATVCHRPEPGTEIVRPPDVYSRNGRLEITLSFHHEKVSGADRYCYLDESGHSSPTLRVHPGDLVLLHFSNKAYGGSSTRAAMHHATATNLNCAEQSSGRSNPAEMTNLHFHGMELPPVCHQDDVLHTNISPGSSYTYSFQVPKDAPPGLDWYHPHVHGMTTQQVLGGASGALIVEGMETAQPAVRGLRERVLVIRDQDLMHPDAPPSPTEPVVPKQLIETDGDSANS